MKSPNRFRHHHNHSGEQKRNIVIQITVFILLFSFFVMLPTIFGFLLQTNSSIYTGLHILSPIDYPVYYSYIQQTKEGHLAFKNLYTSEPHQRIINPFWLLIGLFAKTFSISTVAAFHIARAVLIPVFIVVLYAFVSVFVTPFKFKHKRILGSLFILTSGGFGMWVTPFLKEKSVTLGEYAVPPDMWTAEANTFLTLLHSPHFIASLTLLLLFIILWIKSFHNSKSAWLAGVVLLFWFWFHPFYIITAGALVAAYTTVLFLTRHPDRTTALFNAIRMATVSSPAVLYYVFLAQTDWLTPVRAIQNITLTSSLWLMLLGYGLLIPLSFVGWWRAVRRPEHRYRILATWFPLHWILIYLPIPFQRRLTEGLHVVIALLAWIGVLWTWEKLRNRFGFARGAHIPAVGVVAYFIFIGFSPLGNWLTEFDVVAKRMPHIYFSQNIKTSLEWMRDNLPHDAVILAPPDIATYIPGFTGKTVYAGHGVETAFYHCCKKQETQWFFKPNTSADARATFLKKKNITYVAVSKEPFLEAPIGDNAFLKIVKSLDQLPYLQKIFFNQSIAVYRVLL